jgi:molybdenum cofactor cytidylyltransferase
MLTLHRALSLALDPAAPDVVAVVGGGGKSNAVFRLAKDAHAATGCRAIITHTARIARFQDGWAPAFVEAAEGAELPWPAIAAALDAHGYLLLTGPIVGDRRKGITPAQVDELARRAAELGVGLIAAEADGSKMRPVKAPDSHEPVVPASTTHLLPIIGLDAIGALIDGRGVHRPELVRAVLGLDPVAPVRLTPAHVAQLLTASAGGGKARPAAAALIPLLNKADTPLRLIYGRLTAHLLATMGYSSLVAALLNEGPPVIERWGPVATVVLAAGGSTRLGRPKQVEPVQGAPMVVRAVEHALAGAAGPVVVVTGAYTDPVMAALAAAELLPAVTIAPNLAWASGLASSVHTALAALPPTTQAAIFLPVDQPLLDPLLLRRLVQAWRNGASIAAPLVEWQLRGAPSLFDRTFFGELATVTGDVGGRDLLRTHRDVVVGVQADPAWLLDVDRPEDLAGVA